MKETLLQDYGVDCSGCMTQEVIEKAINKNLNVSKWKYKARQCNCLSESDIGVYNTCSHGCKYCYANSIEIIYYFSLTTNNNIILPQ